ncbi:hypothetical protein TBLA_0G00800 [Henningerozyma blattae CBS 6284]|uniref:SH3 domain-containing protein n=1 Tax=Henningerozyma blattae (strain ATCC 34711 / CBS 6284 / DSM 70876 / NBRC 10599 / NRRL Y-10934 / UCD 77-7) TaxID=1071380 RepID=I2H6M5_HENB6|nr:hypothetical protein TBLA_0G00800 [Tetrapisispora blattae CBS 6284]CCH62027.1 hypothetical protein TBLA_0G00800 [Tetrapisispora blattae CBS 6284]
MNDTCSAALDDFYCSRPRTLHVMPVGRLSISNPNSNVDLRNLNLKNIHVNGNMDYRNNMTLITRNIFNAKFNKSFDGTLLNSYQKKKIDGLIKLSNSNSNSSNSLTLQDNDNTCYTLRRSQQSGGRVSRNSSVCNFHLNSDSDSDSERDLSDSRMDSRLLSADDIGELGLGSDCLTDLDTASDSESESPDMMLSKTVARAGVNEPTNVTTATPADTNTDYNKNNNSSSNGFHFLGFKNVARPKSYDSDVSGDEEEEEEEEEDEKSQIFIEEEEVQPRKRVTTYTLSSSNNEDADVEEEEEDLLMDISEDLLQYYSDDELSNDDTNETLLFPDKDSDEESESDLTSNRLYCLDDLDEEWLNFYINHELVSKKDKPLSSSTSSNDTIKGVALRCNEPCELLDDSCCNNLWKVRRCRDQKTGYIPADYLETRQERLARHNAWKNARASMCYCESDMDTPIIQKKNTGRVRFTMDPIAINKQ